MAEQNFPNFHLNGVPSVKDELSPYEEFAIEFGGKVEFDFGVITNVRLGGIRIQGQFPRILPRRRLAPITVNEFNSLHKKLKAWTNEFWQDQAPEWQQLTEFITIVAYAISSPFFAMDSVEMHITSYFCFWVWHIDDVLEEYAKGGVSSIDIDEALEQIFEILEGKKVTIKSTGKFPDFSNFAKAISNIIDQMTLIVPNYKDICIPFKSRFQKCLDTLSWYAAAPINYQYSEETFIYWRRLNGFWAGAAEFIFLLGGNHMALNIRNSTTFGRILDIADSFSLINDILGLQKELINGEIDNLIVFKIFEKGVPVVTAVENACKMLKKELSDLLLLRDVILRRYLSDPALVHFLDIVESVIDGFSVIHANSKRHMCHGFITIT